MWAAIKSRLFGGPKPTGDPEATAGAPAPETGPASGTSAGGKSELTDGFGRRLADETLDEVLENLEIALLQSDVALPVAERIERNVRKQLAGKRLRWGAEAESAIRSSFESSVREMLTASTFDLLGAIRSHTPKPYVILFVGVNGTGKTTTVAKFAHWLSGQHLTSVIAAGDTFRAGAIEQLLVHGEQLGIRVVRQPEGSDPAAVAYDALSHARARGLDVVLIDTAGRQHTNENLVEEAKKIRRVVQPNLTVFVGDALTGNDALEQARKFQAAIGIDGLILTKLDADAKGGAALSATFVTKKPILFVGTGQGYGDLRPFDPDWMVRRLLGEGAAA